MGFGAKDILGLGMNGTRGVDESRSWERTARHEERKVEVSCGRKVRETTD